MKYLEKIFKKESPRTKIRIIHMVFLRKLTESKLIYFKWGVGEELYEYNELPKR